MMAGRTNGAARSQLRIEATREAEKQPEEKSKVDRLFDLLGADGKLKVYRVVDGEDKYACTLEVDESLVAELEERLAARCGAGDFRVKGFRKDDKGNTVCVASANVAIDPLAHPQRRTEAEQKRGEQAPQPEQKQTSAAELLALMDAAAQRERQRVEASRSNETALFQTMLQMQATSQAQMLELVRSMQGAPAPAGVAGAADPKRVITDVMQMARALGYSPPGEGGPDRSSMSMTERILENPLMKIGERLGDRIADMTLPKPVPSAPAAASPSPQKTQQPAPAALPPRPAEAVPPPRARQLSPEELRAELARRRGGAPSSSSAAPPPAPAVADAVPEMAGKS